MMPASRPVKLLALFTLLQGLEASMGAIFIYANMEEEVSLPCTKVLHPNCSSTSWSFCRNNCLTYSLQVSGGSVQGGTGRSERLSAGASCSLRVRDLRAEDAGIYFCEQHLTAQEDGGRASGKSANVYLSVLTVSSSTLVGDLRAGGTLAVSCVLHSYYDPWNCKYYNQNQSFSLSWVMADGSQLLNNPRCEITRVSPCNVTLTVLLHKEDDARRWRCQVNSKTGDKVESFLDVTSSFLVHSPLSPAQSPVPSLGGPEKSHIPVSRIMLCAALPLTTITVALMTWRRDRGRKRSDTDGTELREVD